MKIHYRQNLSRNCPRKSLANSQSVEKPTPKQESAIGALATANQSIIDLIARRYSSPSETMNNAMANSSVIADARKNTAKEAATEKLEEPPTPTSPSSPSTMLNKLSPGNIFKNLFK